MTAYLNVCEMDRGYGGPEEGGWYYDIREPIALIVIPDAWVNYVFWDGEDQPYTWYAKPEFQEQVDALVEKLERTFPHTGKAGYTTYRGGDYNISFGVKPAVSEPQEHPHYD